MVILGNNYAVCQEEEPYYGLLFKDDTIILSLTKEEKKLADSRAVLKLINLKNYRPLHFKERISGQLKLNRSDTLFGFFTYDYLPEYAIMYLSMDTGANERNQKIKPVGIRRVHYDQLDYLETNNLKRGVLGFYISGLVLSFVGSYYNSVVISNLVIGKEKRFKNVIYFGTPVLVLGLLLTSRSWPKRYYLSDYEFKIEFR
jgi:hypothetical protein